MSLAAIETEAGQKYYSFLNFAWGFIADVDLESERFRKLGPVRFAIGCAIRVASMRMYHGRLSYLPAVRSAYSFGRSQSYVDGSLSKNGSAYLANGKSSSISFDRRSLFGRSISKRSSNQDAIHSEVNLVNASTKEEESGDAFENSDDPANQQTSNEHSPAHDQEDQTTAPEENSQSGDHELGQHERGTAAGPTESNDTGPDADSGDVNSRTNDGGGGNQLAMATRPIEAPEHALPIAWKDSAIAYHLQAPFGHPTPDDWSVIESEYVWVTSVYLSHLGNEMMGVPEARLDDDVIYIYTLRKGIGKAQMISVLLGYEDGTHIEKGGEFSCVIPCRAVRLEPLNFITGHMTVDGEPVPHCSIQASVTPHKVNLMSSVSD